MVLFQSEQEWWEWNQDPCDNPASPGGRCSCRGTDDLWHFHCLHRVQLEMINKSRAINQFKKYRWGRNEIASQTETWRRWKACNGRALAAAVTTKVGWVFRGEGCTSLSERRTELKGWEAGIRDIIALLNLGIVNTQGSVWGLLMFIRDLGGEVSLQQDMLGPDSQWVSHPRTWGCGGYNLENDPEMCWSYQ